MSPANLHLLAIGGLLLLAGCGAGPPPQPEVVPALEPVPPPVAEPISRKAKPQQVDDAATRCSVMAAAPPAAITVARAGLVADDASLPEHCRVQGRIDVLASATDAAVAIDFEMRLPSRWTGRYFHQGSDVAQSQLVDALGRNTGAGGLEDNALSRGFAVMSSHPGYAERSPATGTASPRDDGRWLERAAQAAKAMVESYYGRPPDRSYFVGCSEGGREGLLFAHRWPSLFHGIVAVAPRLRETDAALAGAWMLQRFATVAPRARNRERVLSRAFSTEELFVVAEGILAQCDALDGAADGFVMDMAACRFDPSRLQCSSRRTTECLRPAKIKALTEAMAGPRDAAQRALYAPFPWDPGIAAPGWRAWTLGGAGPGSAPDARHAARAAAVLDRGGVRASGNKPPTYAIDLTRALPALQPWRDADAELASAALEDFREQGGKLLLAHGAADPVVSAWATVEFQQRLDVAHRRPGTPGAAGFARSFVVPGMNHCAGGPATDRFDALSAIVDWVEHDRAPQRLEARGSAVLRDESRPLCPWPQVARYRGTGRVHDSASHDCR